MMALVRLRVPEPRSTWQQMAVAHSGIGETISCCDEWPPEADADLSRYWW